MKTRILIFALFLILSVEFIQSQEILTNKDGHKILPEKGDFALGFDATGIFNLFNQPVSFHTIVPNTLFAKFFIEEHQALRGSIGILMEIEEDANENKTTTTNSLVGFGYEMHRGNTRLHLLYGPELAVGFGKIKNEINASSWGGVDNTSEAKSMSIGCGLFIGVEYFILAKVALSGEVGLGIKYVQNTDSNDNKIKNTSIGVDSTGSGHLGIIFHF